MSDSAVRDKDAGLLESMGGRVEPQRPCFARRHKALTALLVLVLVAMFAIGGFAWLLNGKVADIARFDSRLPELGRPAPLPTAGDSLTVLLAGVDARPGTDVPAALRAVEWEPGSARSDTIMVLHIPADRSAAYLVSIPRDSYVPLYDGAGEREGKGKINAALSLYGPDGYRSTVEHLTGVRMDHVAVVDWDGFRAITNALGGVRLNIPVNTRNLDPGPQTLDGDQALAYVRERYSLANGDLGRIQRQQNFLRALAQQTIEEGASANVVGLTKVVDALTSNLTVDAGWTNGDIRSLAVSLRGVRPDDVDYLTVPIADRPYRSVRGVGDVVLLDKKENGRLFDAMVEGQMAQYVDTHRAELLPDSSVIG